jgi:O-antigen ligase
MKNSWKWLIAVGVVLLVVLIIALLIFTRSDYGWMPMMGYRGYLTNNGFGVIGGLIMMIVFLFIPIVLIGLAVFGVVVFLQRSGNKQPQMGTCARCGKPIQADWKVCPYCGKTIK